MPLTIPKLDDRSFEQLLAEAQARIPVHTPEWTNFSSESDPGTTVVQLFAFMTENLLYRANRIPEKNRVKFLTLLHVPLQPASAAEGLVVISNDRGPLAAWPLNAGIEVRAGKVPFLTRTGVCVLPVTSYVFYKKPQLDLDEPTQELYRLAYETFLETPADHLKYYESMPLEAPEIGKPLPMVDLTDGENGVIDASLWIALAGPKGVPRDDVRAAIAGQTLTLGIYPSPQCKGLSLEEQTTGAGEAVDPGLVFEIAAPAPDASGEFGTGPAAYRRLTTEYAEEVLQRPGIVQLRLPDYDRLLVWDYAAGEEGTGDYPPLVKDRDLAKRIVTWIRVRLPNDQDPTLDTLQMGRIAWAGINAARVIQALTVTNERLGVATGAPDQAFKAANTPIIAPPEAGMAAASEAQFILEVQTVDGGWETWRRVDDLFAAGDTDKVYTLDPESGIVTFGDGLRGLRPPAGLTVRASYEYGGGLAGQVAIKAIAKSTALPGGFGVANPVATWGGGAGETAADGERNIPRYLKHRDRLVTASDFRDIALRTPGVDIGRVEVLPLFHPDSFSASTPAMTWPGIVTLMVIPRTDPAHPDAPEPDRHFIDAVCRWLDPRRLLTTEIFVRGPIYVPVYVSVGIVTMPGQMREQVRLNVQAALRDYLSPLTGGRPAEGAADLDPTCSTATAADPCATPRGIGWPLGWPLGVEVRRQDLEATVTRVPGVRYVKSIQLGALTGSGLTVTDTESVPLVGLQLPRLDVLSVREGDPDELTGLLGQAAGAPGAPGQPAGNQVAVPVLPKTC